MRVVTRPDFDGVVCAALLHEAEPIIEPVKWVSPDDMQKKRVQIYPGDIIANLPYNENCHLWFDHHYSNRLDHPFRHIFSPQATVFYQFHREADKGEKRFNSACSACFSEPSQGG